MNINPISFRGMITVKTRENRNAQEKTEVYHTTKKTRWRIIKSSR